MKYKAIGREAAAIGLVMLPNNQNNSSFSVKLKDSIMYQQLDLDFM